MTNTISTESSEKYEPENCEKIATEPLSNESASICNADSADSSSADSSHGSATGVNESLNEADSHTLNDIQNGSVTQQIVKNGQDSNSNSNPEPILPRIDSQNDINSCDEIDEIIASPIENQHNDPQQQTRVNRNSAGPQDQDLVDDEADSDIEDFQLKSNELQFGPTSLYNRLPQNVRKKYEETRRLNSQSKMGQLQESEQTQCEPSSLMTKTNNIGGNLNNNVIIIKNEKNKKTSSKESLSNHTNSKSSTNTNSDHSQVSDDIDATDEESLPEWSRSESDSESDQQSNQSKNERMSESNANEKPRKEVQDKLANISLTPILKKKTTQSQQIRQIQSSYAKLKPKAKVRFLDQASDSKKQQSCNSESPQSQGNHHDSDQETDSENNDMQNPTSTDVTEQAGQQDEDSPTDYDLLPSPDDFYSSSNQNLTSDTQSTFTNSFLEYTTTLLIHLQQFFYFLGNHLYQGFESFVNRLRYYRRRFRQFQMTLGWYGRVTRVQYNAREWYESTSTRTVRMSGSGTNNRTRQQRQPAIRRTQTDNISSQSQQQSLSQSQSSNSNYGTMSESNIRSTSESDQQSSSDASLAVSRPYEHQIASVGQPVSAQEIHHDNDKIQDDDQISDYDHDTNVDEQKQEVDQDNDYDFSDENIESSDTNSNKNVGKDNHGS